MVTLVRKMETLRASIKKSSVNTNRLEEKKETTTSEKLIPEPMKNQNSDTIVITKILKNDNRNSTSTSKDTITDMKSPVTVLKRGETLTHSDIPCINDNKTEPISESGDKPFVVDDKSIDELYASYHLLSINILLFLSKFLLSFYLFIM